MVWSEGGGNDLEITLNTLRRRQEADIQGGI